MTTVRIRIVQSLLKLSALINVICSIVTSDSIPNGTPNGTPNNNNALQPFGGSFGGFPSLAGGFPGQGGGFPGFGGQGGGFPSSSNNPSFPGQSPNPFFGGFPGFANQSPATNLGSPSQPATAAATTFSGPGAKASKGLMKRDTFGSAEPTTTTSTQSDPFGIKALLESIKSSSSSSANPSQPSSSFIQTREIATPVTTSGGITDTTTTTTTVMDPTTTRTRTTTVTETNLPPISGESRMNKDALSALFLLLLLCLW